jgi:hypothetical protein
MQIFLRAMRRYTWLAAASAVLLTSCGGGLSEDATTRTDALVFSAELNAAQETPPGSSNATGVGLAIVDANDLRFAASVVTTGMLDTQATVGQAAPAVAGPVSFTMEREPGKTVWNLRGVLTPAQRDAMRAGGLYFNVASPGLPEGEIRGQIVFRLPSRDQLQRLLQVAEESRALQELLARASQQVH